MSIARVWDRWASALAPVVCVAAGGLSPLGCSSSPHHGTPVTPVADAGSLADASTDGASVPVMDASRVEDAPLSGDADAAPATDAGPPQCIVDYAWQTRPASPWTAAVGRFAGVSEDELTMAWTTAGDAQGMPVLQVATRADTNSTFGAPITVSTASAPIDDDRAALDRTGQLIVAVAQGRTSLVAFSPSGQDGGDWTEAPSSQFANLAAMAQDTGAGFYEPVLGADGALYYVLGASAGPLHLYRSTWEPSQLAWSTGVVLVPSYAGGTYVSPDATHLVRPTGASSDGRTLFLFDGIAGLERSAWRDSTSAPFSVEQDLAAFPEAAPNRLCVRLYFQQTTHATPPSVYTAE